MTSGELNSVWYALALLFFFDLDGLLLSDKFCKPDASSRCCCCLFSALPSRGIPSVGGGTYAIVYCLGLVNIGHKTSNH